MIGLARGHAALCPPYLLHRGQPRVESKSQRSASIFPFQNEPHDADLLIRSLDSAHLALVFASTSGIPARSLTQLCPSMVNGQLTGRSGIRSPKATSQMGSIFCSLTVLGGAAALLVPSLAAHRFNRAGLRKSQACHARNILHCPSAPRALAKYVLGQVNSRRCNIRDGLSSPSH
jgi:hypothetical protein